MPLRPPLGRLSFMTLTQMALGPPRAGVDQKGPYPQDFGALGPKGTLGSSAGKGRNPAPPLSQLRIGGERRKTDLGSGPNPPNQTLSRRQALFGPFRRAR